MTDTEAELQGFVIDDPGTSAPGRTVAVFVHDTVEAMHDYFRTHARGPIQGGWEWDAISSDYSGADDEDYSAEIHLARTRLYLSVIAHEATHVALFFYARDKLTPRASARAHITNHSEDIPELVGNLTAHIIYGLRRHGDGDNIDRED